MLIELENVSSINSDDQKLAFKNLLNSHQNGFHFVFINEPPEEFEQFSLGFLGDFERTVFYSILENFTTRSELINELSIRTKVDFSSKTNTIKYNNINSIIQCCYSIFLNPKACHQTRLVLEDEDDDALYSEIAWVLNCQLLGTRDTLSYETVHGGGSRTPRELRRTSNNGYFTLCFIDSDKPHPEERIGSTARALNPEIREGVNGLRFVKLLDVHEVENLLPLNVVREVTNRDYPDNIDYVDRLETQIREDFTLQKYVDLKRGISIKKAWDLDNKNGRYWLNEEKRNAFLIPRCTPCLRSAYRNNRFACLNNNSCSYLESFNDELLGKGASALKVKSPSNIRKMLNESELERWQEISNLISSWCFSEPLDLCS